MSLRRSKGRGKDSRGRKATGRSGRGREGAKQKGPGTPSRRGERSADRGSGKKSRSGKRIPSRAQEEELPPSVPDYIAAAETIVEAPRPKKKTSRTQAPSSKGKTSSTPRGKGPRIRSERDAGSIQASDTSVDEMDGVGEEELPPLRRDSGPVDTPTPPMGTSLEDEDVLEPIEGDEGEGESPAGEETPSAFLGSGLGLAFRLWFRNLFALAGLAALAGAAGAAVVTGLLPAQAIEQVPPEVLEAIREAKQGLDAQVKLAVNPTWLLAGAAGLFLLLGLLLARAVRNYRIANTWVFDEPVVVRAGFAAVVVQALAVSVIFLATAGLATPWIIAWTKRFRLQHAALKARRREKPLDFSGTGGQAVGVSLFGLLTFPLVPLTAGIWLTVIQFKWIRWEQENWVVPASTGKGTVTGRFYGSWGPYFAKVFVGWLISLITAGLGRPWAIVSKWRWIAENTFFPPGEERKSKRGKTGRRRR